MPRWAVNLLLFVAAAEVLWRFWRTTSREMRRFPTHRATLVGLRFTLVFLVCVLLMNAFGMVSDTLVRPWMEAVEQPPPLWTVLRGQLALVLGTWGLFALVAGAMTRGVLSEPDDGAGVLRGTVSALESLLKRFGLAALGLGTVFGVGGDGVVILVLGVELLFVWGLLRVQLALHERARPATG